jgi:hypothetical protein
LNSGNRPNTSNQAQANHFTERSNKDPRANANAMPSINNQMAPISVRSNSKSKASDQIQIGQKSSARAALASNPISGA